MMILPKSAWNEGVSIWQAVEIYSSDELWREFKLLDEKFSVIPGDFPHEPFKQESQPPLTVSPAEEAVKYRELHDKLKAEIVAFLWTGKLLGVGFLRPKNRDAEPRWISANDWNDGCKISWDNSELWVQGKIFEEVRIVQPLIPIMMVAESSTLPVELAPNKPERRPGRPTLAPTIKSAYEMAKAARRIDYGKTLSENLPIIQSFVHSIEGTDPSSTENLEYEAVRRAIGEQFKSDKAQAQDSSNPSS